jgi:hypothetical protein
MQYSKPVFQKTDVRRGSGAGFFVLTSLLAAALMGASAGLLTLGGCDDRSAGAVIPDGAVGDGSVDVDADLPPDGDVLTVTDEVGWYSTAFEHSGFVAEQDIDPQSLEYCDAYIDRLEGREMWWVYAPSHDFPLGLTLFPATGGYEDIGLIRVSGTISELGEYGHMGYYDRELTITDYTLLTCRTVAELGHCVVPEVNPDSRREELWRELPGPDGWLCFYDLTVVDNENVLDGETRINVHFSMPCEVDPGLGWEVFELADIQEITLTEERLWHAYEVIHFNEQLEGWVMRDETGGRLKISVSGYDPEEGTRHVWVDAEVDGDIAYP